MNRSNYQNLNKTYSHESFISSMPKFSRTLENFTTSTCSYKSAIKTICAPTYNSKGQVNGCSNISYGVKATSSICPSPYVNCTSNSTDPFCKAIANAENKNISDSSLNTYSYIKLNSSTPIPVTDAFNCSCNSNTITTDSQGNSCCLPVNGTCGSTVSYFSIDGSSNSDPIVVGGQKGGCTRGITPVYKGQVGCISSKTQFLDKFYSDNNNQYQSAYCDLSSVVKNKNLDSCTTDFWGNQNCDQILSCPGNTCSHIQSTNHNGFCLPLGSTNAFCIG